MPFRRGKRARRFRDECHSLLPAHAVHVSMADTKKRPHEADGEYLSPNSDESAPVAKRMKLFDEEDGLAKRPSPDVSVRHTTCLPLFSGSL